MIGKLLVQTHGPLVVRLFFVYMSGVAKLSEAEIRMALQDTLEPVFDPEMQAVWEQFEAGERQGKLKGEIDGEIKGQRKLLLHQLGQRFGVLPRRATARINSASVSEIEAMALRVLSAPTLDEVLGKPVDPTS